MNSKQEDTQAVIDNTPQQFEALADYDPARPISESMIKECQTEFTALMSRAADSEDLEELIELTAKVQSILFPIKTRSDLLDQCLESVQTDLDNIKEEQKRIREGMGLFPFSPDPTQELISRIGQLVISETPQGNELQSLLMRLRYE